MAVMQPPRTGTVLWLMAGILLPLSHGAGSPAGTISQRDTRAVIVDTDAGADDLMAIAFLLSRRDVDIEAITVTAGLAHPRQGAVNILRVLELAGRRDTPVFVGRETPLAGAQEFPSDWRRASDELRGVTLPAVSRQPEARAAAVFLADRLSDRSRPVDLLALGPLTTVAEALERRPAGAQAVQTLVIMGGAVHVPGNLALGGITDNKTAEWNFFVDPVAAAKVFASRARLRLIPLDATEQVPIDTSIWQELEFQGAAPLARLVAQVLGTVASELGAGKYFAWDPLAAVALVDPSVVRVSALSIEIVQQPPNRGQSRAVPKGKANVTAGLAADAQRFRQVFLNALAAH